ncbi:type II toxin-antitoxin system RelE family toxin [Pararhizobium sp. LjRoot238]|uniref:type II toxin-antitoxin system RelE family toxin n=1 Tax=Pararhizobium sp. LjRoot238 TaxID=3342293 RepID=UPI003ECEF66D
MSYKLKFLVEADKEWRKLDANTRMQFKKKLLERLETPRVPSAKLHGSKDRYKIKLRSSGYRLVYEVRDADIVVPVIAVGKRERSEVYKSADRR